MSTSAVDVQEFLRYVVDKKASDLHVKAGGPPYVRISGHLVKTDFAPMSAADCERTAMELMNDEQAMRFKQVGEVDFAYSIAGMGRFRVNVFRQRGSVGMALRRVLPGSPSFETLGLPPVVRTLAEEHRGLLLITGPTSSGKTTTTGAMINHINATRSCHILTIEDPIEILHPDRQAIVNQREIGLDTNNFATALRAAMRQDPDVIFVGEIRDPETVKAALQAAETGHLVISTLHTTDVTETVNRIIDFFPPHQQKQIRVSIAGSLKGILSQRLLPRKDGRGRVPAIEVLVMNGRIRDLVLDPERTHEIFDIVKESSFYGMQTFDQALLSLYRSGLVTLEDARNAATNPHDFDISLQQEGLLPVAYGSGVSKAPSVPLAELLADGSPVLRLSDRFRECDHALYLVGGTVRDAFLARGVSDHDFATDASPEETLEIVKPEADAVWLQGFKFGTVGAEIDGVRMEITTFRTERYEEDSRHPEVSFTRDIEVDLSRRDFTINAMAVRLPEKEAIDPFGGLGDLKARVLKTPIEPDASFADDPLRMLRAFRFAAQLEFKIAPEVLESIGRLKEKLATISAERIRDELSRLLLGSAPGAALELADGTGITDLFLPELSMLKLEQDPVHKHKDVFHHTLAVLERTDPVLELRLAALLHDIGKPKTRRIGPEGVSFHHHEVVGADMARERLRALRYPNEVVGTVEDMIRLHHRFHTYRLGWSDSAVRRYVRDAGPLLEKLNALVRADCTTRNPAKAKRLAGRMDELEARIGQLAQEEEIHKLRPDLDGVQIAAYLGVEPGRIIGEARTFLLDARIEDGPLGEDEAYRRLNEWARERGIEPAGERVPPREKKNE